MITLDRPEVLNAFDEALTSALTVAIDEVAADAAVRAVVITGAGRGFSAGQDLRDRFLKVTAGEDLELGNELRRRYHPLIAAIRVMRKPVIAAVNGVVAGAGLGVAVACDVRVASSSAVFRAAWSRIGLVPDAGSAYFLPRIVGWGRAMDMILTGDPVDANEALRIGLVTRVWPDRGVRGRMADVREHAGRRSDRGVRAIKGGAQRRVGSRFRVVPRAGVVAPGPRRPHARLRRGRAGVHVEERREVPGKIEG